MIEISQRTYLDRASRTKFITEEFPECVNGKVLDVGCGEGYLRNHINDYLGIDISGSPDEFVNLESVSELPFDDQLFDCCLAIDVLEHLENMSQIFSELQRVSKKYVLISLPNMFVWSLRLGYMKGEISSRTYGLKPTNKHKWFFNFNQAIEFINDGIVDGFRISRELGVTGKSLRKYKFVRSLSSRWPNLLCWTYWVLLIRND